MSNQEFRDCYSMCAFDTGIKALSPTSIIGEWRPFHAGYRDQGALKWDPDKLGAAQEATAQAGSSLNQAVSDRAARRNALENRVGRYCRNNPGARKLGDKIDELNRFNRTASAAKAVNVAGKVVSVANLLKTANDFRKCYEGCRKQECCIQ